MPIWSHNHPFSNQDQQCATGMKNAVIVKIIHLFYGLEEANM